MTLAELAAQRLHRQRLVGPPLESVPVVIRRLGAVQAQDYAGAKWALAQRTTGADSASIDALFDAGAVLRTHVMRPTWHFVLPEDLRWLLALTRDRVVAANASYDRKLELDDAVFARSHALLAAALEGGRHRTRQELAEALEAGGLPARGQRLAHLVMRAEVDGLVCSGPRRGKQFTYALLDERVSPTAPRPREEALADLALRYFTSRGPATVRDFAWWSGLTVTEARAALALIQPDLERVTMDGTDYWLTAPVTPAALPAPTVHLLPNYDEHVVAYRDHGPSLDPGAPEALKGWGTALTAHQVVRDGLVVGGWRRALASDGVTLTLSLLASLDAYERAALAAAAGAYGRFLGLPVAVTEAGRGLRP